MSSTSWTNERDFDVRGQKGNSYVASNGEVSEVSTGMFAWNPALTGLDITAAPTPGTTLLSIYNNDNVIVPGSNVYGKVALNRPMIVDEIGIRLIPITGSNYKDYRLSANVLWLNQAAYWVGGTCETYWMNNLNLVEGYGNLYILGGITLRANAVTKNGVLHGGPIPNGILLIGQTSGASGTVLQQIIHHMYILHMTDATDFTVGETLIGTDSNGDVWVCTNLFSYNEVTIGGDNDRTRWSPDRLYNAAVGPTEQPAYIPLGHGPNTFVAYANADGETVSVTSIRPLVPIISDSAESPGTFRPPKDSIIIDPGQSIAIQVQNLYVPPVAHYYSAGWNTLAASGTYSIAAWIRFRMPLMNEQVSCLRKYGNDPIVY